MFRILAALLLTGLMAQAAPRAIASDPVPDKAHPAAMQYVRIPSHGTLLNGVLYTAAGAGPHPAVMLFHGFPGNEQNLDLAQAMRRAGFDVLTMHYRGSWGSPGNFSFNHCTEDADAAIAFLQNKASAFHIDPARIFAAGHSMGGFMAVSAAAHEPKIAGLIMISAWNIGRDGAQFRNRAFRQKQLNGEFRDDVYPLVGTTADALMDEAMTNARDWDFGRWAPQLMPRPVLLVTSDDGLAGHVAPLAQALGAQATKVHIADDHSYSGHRIALESAVLDWLAKH
jgi:pimeloyl-ACP methyl ester carboxylesterase